MNYKLLSFAVLSIFLLSVASAVIFDAEWESGGKSAIITNGESIILEIPDGGSMHLPVTMIIRLNSNIIYSDNNFDFPGSVIITPSDYNSQSGYYVIDVIGTDSLGNGYEELTLHVNPSGSNNPPIAENQGVTTNQNTPVTITLTADDEDDLTYFIINYPLHGDLSNPSSTGQVIYTPDYGFSGSDSFTFKANDGLVDSNIATVSITVSSSGNTPPTIDNIPNQKIIEGNYYSYEFTAEDDEDDLTYSLFKKPDWLNIENSNIGLITGTAPLVNSSIDYEIIVEVSDGVNLPVRQTYTLTVKNYVSGSGGNSRTISDSDIYYQNKYFDQFNKDVVLYTKPKTQNLFGLTALTFFYFLIAIISLGIIIVAFLLGKNLRR